MKPTPESIEESARAHFGMGVFLFLISQFTTELDGEVGFLYLSGIFISLSLLKSYFVYKAGGYDESKLRPLIDWSDKIDD